MNTDQQDTICKGCGCDAPACRCDEMQGYDDDDFELDEFEDELGNCCGFFESQSPNAVWMCGAVGSEDCDECPCYAWLGLTNKQIDDLDTFEGELL